MVIIVGTHVVLFLAISLFIRETLAHEKVLENEAKLSREMLAAISVMDLDAMEELARRRPSTEDTENQKTLVLILNR